ncbi:transposable element Tcb2 transposase [Trichonephila clavipes]|nr:transposable element Tcb2 transposase [Trichonephila clavipes]
MGRIILMMDAGWSARRVSRQLGRFHCIGKRCWDQCVGAMSFTQRPGSGHPRQTKRPEDRHIVRNACVQPTALSTVIKAQVRLHQV